MAGFTVHIEGLAELDAKLKELGDDEAKRIINSGLQAGGRVFQAAVQERAPERPDLPSGTALPVGALAADIVRRLGRDEDGLPAVIVGPGKATARVARWVEYSHRLVRGGTNRKGRGGRGQVVGSVPAHPFIRPAFEVAGSTAVDAFVNTTREGIEQAAKK